MNERPDQVFDVKLQHERTALSWERTAIAMMVSGVLLGRHVITLNRALAALGIVQVAVGAGLLIWTGLRYEQLHAPLRRGESPVNPRAAKFIGLATVTFTGAATIVSIGVALI